MSNIRATVIDAFLAALEADSSIQPEVTTGLRTLLDSGQGPTSDTLIALIQENATPITPPDDKA